MKVITMLPITRGSWTHTTAKEWEGIYFMELVFDWTLFPPYAKGKLYAEIMGNREAQLQEDHIAIRLAYQLEPAIFTPVLGSEIEHKGSLRWQLLESEWFDLPKEKGVSCIWIQGKAMGGPESRCNVALVTLAIADFDPMEGISDAFRQPI